jgi:hypothetical protein
MFQYNLIANQEDLDKFVEGAKNWDADFEWDDYPSFPCYILASQTESNGYPVVEYAKLTIDELERMLTNLKNQL